MSQKEDDDKVKMSQCEKKSMVVQGIKDRSRIRKHKVTKKQGCGEEGEIGEAREEKQGKTRGWVSMGRREDPGKIQGRSIDLRGLVFRGIGGSIGKGIRARGGLGGGGGEGETRMIGKWRSPWESSEE